MAVATSSDYGTTLSHYFFGADGQEEITHQQFYDFMHDLQAEVLEIEFNAFSHGKWEITELQFAEMLLRYSDAWDMENQLSLIQSRFRENKSKDRNGLTGINIEEFKSFFFFLNNLESFATAVHLYSLANEPMGKRQFNRAVKIATGEELSQNLINTVYTIFDTDGDEMLSHSEFLGVMYDRVNRQKTSRKHDKNPWETMKHCYAQKRDSEQSVSQKRS